MPGSRDGHVYDPNFNESTISQSIFICNILHVKITMMSQYSIHTRGRLMCFFSGPIPILINPEVDNLIFGGDKHLQENKKSNRSFKSVINCNYNLLKYYIYLQYRGTMLRQTNMAFSGATIYSINLLFSRNIFKGNLLGYFHFLLLYVSSPLRVFHTFNFLLLCRMKLFDCLSGF